MSKWKLEVNIFLAECTGREVSVQMEPPPRIRTFVKYTYQCMCPGKVGTCFLREKCVPSRGVDLRLPAHFERVILSSISNSCTLLALFHCFSLWHGLVNQITSIITRLTKKSTVEGLQRSISIKFSRVSLPSYSCRFTGSPAPIHIWLNFCLFFVKVHTIIVSENGRSYRPLLDFGDTFYKHLLFFFSRCVKRVCGAALKPTGRRYGNETLLLMMILIQILVLVSDTETYHAIILSLW